MKNYLTSKIRNKYKTKALIIPIYASAKKPHYSIEDLEEFDKLQFYLGEVNDHEADITETGIHFLEDTFGLRKLAELLYANQWYLDEYHSPEAINEWLVWWKTATRKEK